MDKLTYKYYRKNGGEKAYIVIHGSGSVGVETGFITSIFDAIAMTKSFVLISPIVIAEKIIRAEQN